VNPRDLAEQATLGSLLTEPTAVAQVTKWLRAGDFCHPWHQAVYTVIRERHAAGAAIDPQAVGADLVDRHGYRRADLPRIIDLLQAAPVRPAAATYATMVLEAALRREVAAQGVLLKAAALSAALAGESRPAVIVAAMVDAVLDSAAYRWAAATGDQNTVPPRTAPLCAPIRAAVRNRDDRLGADRFLSAHPPLDDAAAAQNEAELVASLVSHPTQIAETAGWLRPDALTNTAWRPVYACLVQLAELDRPVDVVTVAWEVQRTSARLGPGPGIRDLRTAVDATASYDPGWLGRRVAADQLRRTADRAADALQTAADNPGLDLRDLLTTGHLCTEALRTTAAPLPTCAEWTTPARHPFPVPDLTTHPDRAPVAPNGPVAG
jgi:replicative DNA helicase